MSLSLSEFMIKGLNNRLKGIISYGFENYLSIESYFMISIKIVKNNFNILSSMNILSILSKASCNKNESRKIYLQNR